MLSHGALVLVGGWLAGGTRSEPAQVATLAAPAPAKPSPTPTVEEATANPILRATGADFRAAWDELLAGPRSSNGEVGGNSISLLIDWCRVDPEGAVQGLGRLHAPRFAHNYPGNAINYHGAELAPAMVKHWRKLERMDDYKVQSFLGRSLNALAKKDPDAAAALTHDLPPGMRKEVYDELFDKQDTTAIGRLLKGVPSLAPDATDERTAFWTAVAAAVDAADSKGALWDWMVSTTDVTARQAFVTEGMTKAHQAEDWSGFFDAVERMDPPRQLEVRDHFRKVFRSAGYPEARAAISAECQRHGWEDWLEEPAAE
ncbi:hypothetical protein OKA05_13575 [Luteolibacter arcticus]|uniref:DUF4034 domain-containing protein n=1 Tax=Luteolibacter arcticus TaxID=1581411 RepID=A0ABT3GJB9_9BACT|nr:hypothetical protein [Luteolibacter arcticus]MCW1923589.1 hypothetical protein [Luteolibacter arcticus]